ncbi:MAG TPA: hypothetical protein VGF97_12910 [Rhizomicrobium sp.]
MAATLPGWRINGAALVVAGFLSGLGAATAVALHIPAVGLALIVASRSLVLMARHLVSVSASGASDFLDTLLGWIVFAGMGFAFALADPERALAACFLVASFVGLSASAVDLHVSSSPHGSLAAKESQRRREKTIIDATITVALVIACLWSARFSVVAYVLGTLCFSATGIRIARCIDVSP